MSVPLALTLTAHVLIGLAVCGGMLRLIWDDRGRWSFWGHLFRCAGIAEKYEREAVRG